MTNTEKNIEINIECPACNGTGIYSGVAESHGVGVVCYKCDGTGEYLFKYSYKEFKGRNKREDIKRVYLSGYGYRLGLGNINFKGVGEIDMDKEGVSYEEFFSGKLPKHIRKLGCPMSIDQGMCHDLKGFVDECDRLDGKGLLGRYIKDCNYQNNKDKCWERFDKYFE